MSSITNASIFLVELIFDAYIIILMLRLIMQKLGAHYYNPISQLIIKLTDLFVIPLRRVIPGFKGFDSAIMLLILLFEIIEMILITWFRFRIIPGFGGTLIVALGMIGVKVVNLYFYLIIMRVIMSWIISLQQGPVAEVIYLITEPLMSRARRFIPPIAGFDLSPIAVVILLQLISILALHPLIEVGMRIGLTN